MGRGRGAGRYSVGGGAANAVAGGGGIGGARRVRVEPVWKVRDIVVPGPVKEDVGVDEGVGMRMGGTPVRIARGRVSEAERKVSRVLLIVSIFTLHLKCV